MMNSDVSIIAFEHFGIPMICLLATAAATPSLLAAPVRESGPGLSSTGLRCEYQVDPLGIDAPRPRLSWIVTSAERGQRQIAYQVLVASSDDALKRDQGDLWDSGQVKSDDTTAIVYGGKPLLSSQRCYWKVKVWDKNDRPSTWSSPALWSMGLLKPSDWKGEWIGYDKPREATSSPSAAGSAQPKLAKLVLPPPAYFRVSCQVKKPVRRATVYATALGLFDLRLNGQRVANDYFNPGWTDYTRRVYYRAYDVTNQIHPGNNALGAILADGWYSGYVGYGKLRDHYGKHPRFKGQLHLEYADGSSETVATGTNWKAATGPTIEADFLMGETYDAQHGRSWLGRP